MTAEIIIYGLVAAGLVFWLKNVLGTRHGQERQRPNPLANPPPGSKNSAGNSSGLLPVLDIVSSIDEDKEPENIPLPAHMVIIDDPATKDALAQITRLDSDFAIKPFLENAQDAFAIIVESYASGDLDTLRDLLAANVFKNFETAIVARQNLGHTLETQIHAIRKTEIINATINGKIALITLRFTAQETFVLRNATGEILEGHPDRTHEMRDVWIFSRDLKSRDPRWLLLETRGDVENDNAYIPNTAV